MCRFRTGSDRRKGSDRICELTKGIRTGLELVTGGGLARRKAVYLGLELDRGSDRSYGAGSDRIGAMKQDRIGSE